VRLFWVSSVYLLGLLDDGSKWKDLLQISYKYPRVSYVQQTAYQIIGSVNDSELYVVVIELFNQSK